LSSVTLSIRFEPRARLDMNRLIDFLDSQSASAAVRAARLIRSSIATLTSFPERCPLVTDTLRQLTIPFGDSGYVVQYRVDPDHIIVARVFHMREDR